MRGRDLLQALVCCRIDSTIIRPVDPCKVDKNSAPERQKVSKHAERDAAAQTALASFLDHLDDGACMCIVGMLYRLQQEHSMHAYLQLQSSSDATLSTSQVTCMCAVLAETAKARSKIVDAFMEHRVAQGEPEVPRTRLLHRLLSACTCLSKTCGRYFSHETASAMQRSSGMQAGSQADALAKLAKSGASAALKRHVAGPSSTDIAAFAVPSLEGGARCSTPAGCAASASAPATGASAVNANAAVAKRKLAPVSTGAVQGPVAASSVFAKTRKSAPVGPSATRPISGAQCRGQAHGTAMALPSTATAALQGCSTKQPLPQLQRRRIAPVQAGGVLPPQSAGKLHDALAVAIAHVSDTEPTAQAGGVSVMQENGQESGEQAQPLMCPEKRKAPHQLVTDDMAKVAKEHIEPQVS